RRGDRNLSLSPQSMGAGQTARPALFLRHFAPASGVAFLRVLRASSCPSCEAFPSSPSFACKFPNPSRSTPGRELAMRKTIAADLIFFITVPVWAAPPESRALVREVKDLGSPALPIYNQDFAVVRQMLPLDLNDGPNLISFTGATSRLEPDSVILRDPTGKRALQVMEQNYRNDPVNQALLLSMFEGQTIDFLVKNYNKPDEIVKGKVIRSGYIPGGGAMEPIIEVDGKVMFQLPGQPQFPSL